MIEASVIIKLNNYLDNSGEDIKLTQEELDFITQQREEYNELVDEVYDKWVNHKDECNELFEEAEEHELSYTSEFKILYSTYKRIDQAFNNCHNEEMNYKLHDFTQVEDYQIEKLIEFIDGGITDIGDVNCLYEYANSPDIDDEKSELKHLIEKNKNLS